MGAYRFALRPAWLATHLLVVAVVTTMVGLGFWQLDRLDQRRDRNALVEARAALPAEPVGALADPGTGGEALDELRFRAVEATGTYDPDGVVTVRATQDGATGAWVLSPLRLGGEAGDEGEVVVVLRGFAATNPDGSVPEPAPPAGTVRVEGLAVPVGRAERTVRTAAERLAEGRDGVLPVLVQAEASDPADDPALAPVPRPDLGEGPHLSYAVQWFLFATVVAAGYPFLLRREVRRRGGTEGRPGRDAGVGAGAQGGLVREAGDGGRR